VMANHKLEDVDRAADIMAQAKALGEAELAETMGKKGNEEEVR